MDATWQEIDRLFDAALDLPAEERGAYLDAHCTTPEQREKVEQLLAASDEDDDIPLKGSPEVGGLLAGLVAERFRPEPALTGDQVGPYRIVRELGRGGMAAVYLAERADGQFEQRVALKLAQDASADPELLRRFHLERQILASLNHPNIARLLDGGLTQDGRPYFAMELVEGLSLDEYCDENRLSLEQRLRLFLGVGRAVAAAHRALVVHRDLKPTNVLVTRDGDVKLLDFGIAKLLDTEAFPGTDARTRTMRAMMTPEYASPEQFVGDLVTTASDVYQLGLLLYEVLTGRRAYELRGLPPTEVMRLVCMEAPERPSTRVGRLSQVAAAERTDIEEISRCRSTRPEDLRRALDGDLDTIVLKALRKEPERRYASVDALVDDLERFLAGRPIHARGDSLPYRARKFGERHRLAVASTLGGLLLLIALVIFYTTRLGAERNAARAEARRASEARDVAEQAREEVEEVVDFLVDLFEVADPTRDPRGEVNARQLLDEGAARVHRELSGQPLVQARMLDTIARVYRRLGLFEQAQPLVEEAVAARRNLLGAEHPDLAASLQNLAAIHRRQGRFQDAEPLYLEALAIREAALGGDHQGLATSLNGLGLLYNEQGRYEEAETALQRALEILEEVVGKEHQEFTKVLVNLANLKVDMARYEEARALLEQALEIRERVLGAEHYDIALNLHNLAMVHDAIGHTEEAEQLYERSLAMKENLLGREHPMIATTLVNLAAISRRQEKPARAAEMLERAIAIFEKTYNHEHPGLANAVTNLASLALERQEFDRSQHLFERALEIRQGLLGPGHKDVGAAYLNLGEVLTAKGEVVAAERHYRRALQIFEEGLPADHSYTAFGLTALAELLRRDGRGHEAEPLYRRALTILEKRLTADHPALEQIRAGLAALGPV